MQYDSNELMDYNYDDYINPNEKPGEQLEESDKVENVENIDGIDKEGNLGEDEKAASDELKDSAEFASDEEKDYYDDLFGKDDQNDDLPFDDAPKEKSFDVDKNIEGLPLPPIADIDEQKSILNETKPFLGKEEQSDIAGDDVDSKNEGKSETTTTIQDETKDELELAKPEPDFGDILDEDTVNKVYEDLNEDLVKLIETWKKLTTQSEINADDSLSPDDILEYEEKYGRPYKEGVVLSQRDNYYDDENPIHETNDQSDATNEKSTQTTQSDTENNKKENIQNDEQISNNSEEKESDDIEKEVYTGHSLPDSLKDNIDTDYDNISENMNTGKIQDQSIAEKQEPQMYLNNAEKELVTKTVNDVKTMDVSDLSPDQYHQLMEQFKILHNEELTVDSSNVAVIHVPLSLDEPVVVTSPNYPENYPTNNIIDWLFEGDGVGIELNVTDLAVNGVRGDYLLVKPGGVDESGTDGLLFSYRLNEPRRYRFLDVDRMFVRFVANSGFQFFRGFQFSVKMVAPPVAMEEEPLPEPEPELPQPVETHTIVVGGMPPSDFIRIKDDFRSVLADMATLYINSNGVEPGLNTTFDKPQILATEQRFVPRMIREAIEIKKYPNFNREDGWYIPPA
ncbi:hypothetical protein evm_014949 [Chilo suppressalis]|nr:hypothetical protein evm_014949 [Chilo suppressalis]